MKKRVGVCGTLLTIFSLFSVTANAEGREITSNATVQWTVTEDGAPGDDEDLGIVNPVDPRRPRIDHGSEGDGGGTTGQLRIERVSGIEFGKKLISGSTETYQAKFKKYLDVEGTEVYLPTFVQVTDDRGANTGWRLTVSNTPFKDSVTNEELMGAVLILGASNKVYTLNSNDPSVAVSAKGNIELAGDALPKSIVAVEDNKGMGVNTIGFGEQVEGTADSKNDGVTLTVPGIAKKNQEAKYISILTWTLSDTEI